MTPTAPPPRPQRSLPRAALAAWLVSCACAEPPREPVAQPNAAPRSNCQGGDCPTNSPVIATFPFHELPVSVKQKNPEGFSVLDLRLGNHSYTLDVKDGHLRALGGATAVTGSALTGAQLWLARDGRRYAVRVTSVANVAMWARLDPAKPAPRIEAYWLDWAEIVNSTPGEWRNVCADAMLPDGTRDLLGAPNYLTFVFEGERIDANARVITGFDPRWFNLGCAGHTLAKMDLMGHVGAAQSLGYVTTVDERQAIMKMFSADYCGGGYPFTVPGIPLMWFDDKGWTQPPVPGARLRIEARWSASGAECLAVPRVTANPSAESRALWPAGVELDIKARCPTPVPPAKQSPPPCSDADLTNFDGDHLVTANPY